MTTEERKNRIDLLFNQIAFIAEVKKDDKKLIDKLIAPLCKEIIEITKVQHSLGETPNQIYWANKLKEEQALKVKYDPQVCDQRVGDAYEDEEPDKLI